MTDKYLKLTNRIPLTLALIAAAALLAACDKKETTAQQLKQVETKAEDAVQDMKDYSYAEKAEFSAKMRIRLAEIRKDMDQLSAKLEKASASVKAEAQPKLNALREKSDRLETHLAELTNATESTWDSVKTATKSAYETLKDGFHQSRQWVSEKIAP